MQVVVVGTGYVGLVSGTCFADFGHEVICVDKDPKKIETLKTGGVPIYEPGLDQLVKKNVEAKRLNFTTSLPEAMGTVDAVFIAVGTPSRRGDGFADLKYVYSAAEEIGTEIAKSDKDFTIVVNKSTVPVGTGDEVDTIIAKHCSREKFAVVSNPEFLREGAAIKDFKIPDRIVVGTENEFAKKVIKELYRPLFINQTPMLFTSRRTSELIKYAANAFLATKITFINEMADLCEEVGGNVQEVARGIGLDKRIGSKFLHAGPGYGGSCFPKDTLALARTAEEAGVELSIVKSVIEANDTRKLRMAHKVEAAMGRDLKGKTIGVLGLAFKPNTDDMRYAPSLTIISYLQEKGALIKAYDPEAMQEASHLLENVIFCNGAYECLADADLGLIITEWDQFRALDLERIKNLLRSPIIVDLRNIYPMNQMKQAGLNYICVGRALAN